MNFQPWICYLVLGIINVGRLPLDIDFIGNGSLKPIILWSFVTKLIWLNEDVWMNCYMLDMIFIISCCIFSFLWIWEIFGVVKLYDVVDVEWCWWLLMNMVIMWWWLLFELWLECCVDVNTGRYTMFQENYNYILKYRKHYKTPEIIGNCSNTPPFCC